MWPVISVFKFETFANGNEFLGSGRETSFGAGAAETAVRTGKYYWDFETGSRSEKKMTGHFFPYFIRFLGYN